MRRTVLRIATCFHVQDSRLCILKPRKSEEFKKLTLTNTNSNPILLKYKVKTFV